jgi:diguanylate cyclase (GGDEF)-like protein
VKNRIRIALISKNQELSSQLSIHIESKGHQVIVFNDISAVLGYIYSDPPDIIILNLQSPDTKIQTLISELKKDSYFSTLPVIALTGENTWNSFDWDHYPLDDFVSSPVRHNELISRISLSLHRIQRVFDNNPLTKLPGNTSIQHAIENALGEPMSVCYVDINNFKPYNDTYGFTRGDEVIRMVGRIMSNAVRQSGEGGFAGHIGGDDFVFIVKSELAETVCRTIISNFSVIVSDLFGEEEKTRGHYTANDRLGIEQKIPLLGIAIAVVPMNNPDINHYGKVAEIAAELKKHAKKSGESRFIINRRKKSNLPCS